MKSQQRLEEMATYLIKQLEAGNQAFLLKKIPEENLHNNSGKDIYFLQNEENALLLVPDKYTNSPQNKKQTIKHPFSFTRAYNLINQLSKGNCLPIFYKDGETFFRSPFNEQLQNPDKKSLEQYEWEDKHHMIVLSPEEITAKKKQTNIIQKPALTYYQPTSEKLDEMIVSYKFHPATLEVAQYLQEAIGTTSQESKRLFLWNQKLEKPGPIQYANHRLKQT